MSRRYVPQSTIDRRIARKDARHQSAARQLGLASEVLPYASVEIIPAGSPAPASPRICAWCPEFDPTVPPAPGTSHGICARCAARFEAQADTVAFDALLRDPRTGARLDALLAEFAAIDADQLEADIAARAREDADAAGDADEALGSRCSPNCGFCGRCS